MMKITVWLTNNRNCIFLVTMFKNPLIKLYAFSRLCCAYSCSSWNVPFFKNEHNTDLSKTRTSTVQSQLTKPVGRCIKLKSSLGYEYPLNSFCFFLPSMIYLYFLLLISTVRAEYIMKPVHPHEYLNNYYIECLDEVTALCIVDAYSNDTVVVQDMSNTPEEAKYLRKIFEACKVTRPSTNAILYKWHGADKMV